MKYDSKESLSKTSQITIQLPNGGGIIGGKPMRKAMVILTMVLALLCVCLPGVAERNALTIDQSVQILFEGDTLQTALGREGDAANGTPVYASSNPKIATVDADGLVTAVSKGRATITVSVTGAQRTYKAKLNLTVARRVTALDIQTAKLPLHSGEEADVAPLLRPSEEALPVLLLPVRKTVELKVSALPKDATNRKVALRADNDQILRVSGKSISGRQAGETVLTVYSEQNPEVSQRYRVLVVQPVSRISLTLPGKAVAVGGSAAIQAQVTPADASVPRIVWSSADERIATVDQQGVVTGVKRGNARIIAAAQDGSGIRATLSVKVTQGAESVALDHSDITVSAGRSVVLHATVLPKNTDDKGLVWTSSDERIATVNGQGRVTGVSLGDCQIVCASRSNGAVQTVADVHVHQLVTGIVFGEAPTLYVGESAQLTWSTEPANANDATVTFSSSNPKVLTVDAEGRVTGLRAGEAYVNAATVDGSNRRARLKVHVYQHVTGVHMKRHTAYLDVGESAVTTAVLEPDKATNKSMNWAVADPDIVSIALANSQGNKIKLRGLRQGETEITGITVDGGFPTTFKVKVGDWDHALKIKDAKVEGADQRLTVRNDSVLTITSITVEVSVYDINGKPVPANKKDGTNTFRMVYKRTLNPGESTVQKYWKTVDFKLPDSPIVSEYRVKIIQYQIDNDWIKTIREKNRPTKTCPVHL